MTTSSAWRRYFALQEEEESCSSSEPSPGDNHNNTNNNNNDGTPEQEYKIRRQEVQQQQQQVVENGNEEEVTSSPSMTAACPIQSDRAVQARHDFVQGLWLYPAGGRRRTNHRWGILPQHLQPQGQIQTQEQHLWHCLSGQQGVEEHRDVLTRPNLDIPVGRTFCTIAQ